MDGPREYYAKRKKVRERKIPYYFTYTWNLKIQNYKSNRTEGDP